ncbi:hypothetical protein LUZ63_011455 [Rhynchospora breviuscula]|uniref:non-specific serine/threonine protein kinase n=1 Tax=Rhynchospora breviuscula TaxID=2022672 RepID=A0A9Q0CIR9_9POAL|nr:hypothetical protein LUZ63_011455 [Rhynchospora breviuscula]
MKFLSVSICAILLLFSLLGRFFVAAVDWDRGEGANVSPLQASLRSLSGEKKLEVEDWVSPREELDRSLVAVQQQFAGQSAGARALLQSDSGSGTVLFVHDDGKFELKDTGSEVTLWEIPTDNPLPSQSQLYIPTDSEYFLFPGQGSELYVFSRSAGIEKHPLSIEEYVARTPEIRGSTVTIGSKSSTMYTIDAETGEIIYQCSVPVNLSQFGVSMTEDPSLPSQLPSGTASKEQNSKFNYITIIRTDYTVSCSDISRTLWNWTTSFFIAYYPNNDRYMLKPASHTDGTIPIKFKGKGKELFLAWTIDNNALSTEKFEPLQLDSSGDDNRPPKNSLNGLVAGPVYSNNGNRNGLIMSERPFKITNVETDFTNVKRLRYHSWAVLPFMCLVVGIVLYRKGLKEAGKRDKEVTQSNARHNGVPKKKKARKNAVIRRDSSGSMPGTPDDRSSSDGEKLLDNKRKEKLLAHMQAAESSEGKWVGKLLVLSNEIGRGSNGTVVLEGVYDGRPVAVKRLLHAHHDVALKEIRNLIASDQHPNIVRLYGVEQDVDFVYISLERCSCSLADLILFLSGDVSGAGLGVCFSMAGKGMDKDLVLWRENGLPSPQLLKLMRDVVSGLVHLHELGIIHRDLKPQNVLITTEGVVKAKLSDMGISKRLQEDMSSLTRHATGFGSSGWQAPEQLLQGRQSRAVDLFSLGCILFFCITKGKHPFGEYFERDRNIIKNEFDLFLVDFIPEAVHLLSLLLNPNPGMRPKAMEVLNHPFFWNAELRVSFLKDISDRIDKANEPDLINAIESVAPIAFGGKWNEKLDPALIADLGRYRKYNFESVRDLLRVIRNKSGHYRELPSELQESLGSLPEGFDRYFSTRFPKLLIEVYKVVCTHCREEASFSKYFEGSTDKL